MRVTITSPSGYHNPRRGIDLAQNETAELDDALALKLFQHRMAKPAPAPEPETVAVGPSRNTAKRTGKAPPRKSTS